MKAQIAVLYSKGDNEPSFWFWHQTEGADMTVWVWRVWKELELALEFNWMKTEE